MKQIRQRLTYANVMSSIAVFLVLGGATAFAATKIGANELKANRSSPARSKKKRSPPARSRTNAIINEQDQPTKR